MAPSAPEYESSLIRNIAVMGHGGAGKTTLVDAMAYIGGATRRRGRAPGSSPGETVHDPEVAGPRPASVRRSPCARTRAMMEGP